MQIHQSFGRTAAVAAMLSAPFAFGNTITMLMAANFSVEAILDPLMLLAGGAQAAELWRWSMFFDMFGYYLLIIPLGLLLKRRFGAQSPAWAELFGLGLIGYSLVGAIGAGVHAAVLPPLIKAYSEAGVEQQAMLAPLFLAFHNAVMVGLWNTLEMVLAGVGWLGFGVLMLRERYMLGIATIILAASAFADAVGVIFSVDLLATVGLMIYLFLAPIWAFWLGLGLLRNPVPATQSLTDSYAPTFQPLPAEVQRGS